MVGVALCFYRGARYGVLRTQDYVCMYVRVVLERGDLTQSDVSGRIINAATLTRVSTGPCVFDSALEMATFMLLGTCTL